MQKNGNADDIIIGSLIRKHRLECGVNQTVLAKVIGVPQTIVSRIELGERRLTVAELRLICGLLDVSMVEFVAEYQQLLRSDGYKPGG